MAMRPTRPPRKREPILHRYQYRSLDRTEDAAVHSVHSPQQAFSADEPNLRDYRCRSLSLMLKLNVVRIVFDA